MITSLLDSFGSAPLHIRIALFFSGLICFWYGLHLISMVIVRLLKKFIGWQSGPDVLKQFEQELKAKGLE